MVLACARAELWKGLRSSFQLFLRTRHVREETWQHGVLCEMLAGVKYRSRKSTTRMPTTMRLV